MRESLYQKLVEGGPGSGNWGHEGIPGEQGGSKAGTGGMPVRPPKVGRLLPTGTRYGFDSDGEKFVEKSRVKDTLYHGSPHYKDIINQGFQVSTDELNDDEGISFSFDPKYAADYTGDDGMVVAVKVFSSNPYNVLTDGGWENPDVLEYMGKRGLDPGLMGDYSRALRSLGYDAIVMPGEVRVFSPQQILILGGGMRQWKPRLIDPEDLSEGGPGSGNFGHSGILGQQGGSTPGSVSIEYKETFDQITKVDLKGATSASYFIAPGGQLVDTNQPGVEGEGDHEDFVRGNPEVFGLKPEDLRRGSPLTKVERAGFIRVRSVKVTGGPSYLNLETERIDTKTLRKLQNLYDQGKLPKSDKIEWDGTNGYLQDTWDALMLATKVSTLGGSVSLREFSRPLERFAPKAGEFSLGQSLSEIKLEYQETLSYIMLDYLTSPGNPSITRFRNQFRRAVNDAFTITFYTGWADSKGGEIPDEAVTWLVGRIETESGYADGLWEDLKSLKRELDPDEVAEWIWARAEGYTHTLDGIYSEARVRGALEMPLTFGGEDGEESCSTCQYLKGKTYPARWWVENGLIPGQSGNENFECKGYRCRHILLDPDGDIFTGPQATEVAHELWYLSLFEGGPGSGNFGHVGVPGQHGGSAPKIEGAVSSYDEISSSSIGKAYLVNPDGILIDAKGDHFNYIKNTSTPEALGLTKEDQEPGNMKGAIDKIFKAGVIRVREFPDKSVAIMTGYFNTKELKRLQNLILDDRIKVEDGKEISWFEQADDSKSEGRGIIRATRDEFLSASGVYNGQLRESDASSLSEGGQGSGNFGHLGVPGQHGGSASSGKPVSFQPGSPKGDAFHEEVKGWEGERASIGARATSFGWKSKGAKGVAIVDSEGKLAAVAQIRQLSPDKVKSTFGEGIPDGKYIEIMDLATRESGWGRQIMQDIVDRAAKAGSGVILVSAESAMGFYRKLGMVQGQDESVFYYTPEQCKEYSRIQEVLPAVALEDEPIEFIKVTLEITSEGGPTSGNWGHDGIPGQHGGSAPGGGFSKIGVSSYTSGSRDEIEAKAALYRDLRDREKELGGVGGKTPRGQIKMFNAEDRAKVLANRFSPGYWPVDQKHLDLTHRWMDEYGSSKTKDMVIKGLSGRSGLDYETCNHLVKSWAGSSNDNSPASLNLQLAASEFFGTELSEWQKERYAAVEEGAMLVREIVKAGDDASYYLSRGMTEEANEAMQRMEGATRRYDSLFAPWIPDKMDLLEEWEAAETWRETGAYDKFIRAVYDETQDFFKSQGYKGDDEIYLYRGIHFPGDVDFGTFVEYQGNCLESWTTRPGTTEIFGNVALGIKVPISNIFSTAMSGIGCLSEREMVILGGNFTAFVARKD